MRETLLDTAQSHGVAYEKTGSGPPILFIHGLTYDRQMWGPVVARLAGDYTCIAIDLPGHGKSADASTYDLLAVTRKIHAAFAQIESRPPIVVGHSIGMLYAVTFAAMYPVAGLVTSDQTLNNLAFLERLGGMREALQSPAFAGIWRAIESELGIDLIPESRRALIESASNPRQDVVLGYWREAFDTPPAVLQAFLLKFVANIEVPFSAVFGDDVQPDYRSWLRPVAPQCEIVVFPNSGHFPHLVEVEGFAAEVRAVAERGGLISATRG